jgi:hypothetical protein
MISLTWKPLTPFTLPASDAIAWPWIMACEDLGVTSTYLKLKATGKWQPMEGLSSCGPDGLTGQTFLDDRLFVTDCPLGALIGRIGGSSASLKVPTPTADSGETKAFAVGAYALVKLPKETAGPLYLGFNTPFRPLSLESLSVDMAIGS